MNPFNNLHPKLTASDKISQKKTSTIVKNTRVFTNKDTTFESKNNISNGIKIINEKCNDISCNMIDTNNCHNFNNNKNKGCTFPNSCNKYKFSTKKEKPLIL